MALVEQTRRRVLCSMPARSGDMARAMGLQAPPAQEALYREEDLLDLKILQSWPPFILGPRIPSLPPRLLKENLFQRDSPIFKPAKDHYDLSWLSLRPKGSFEPDLLHESDQIFFITWDQATDLAGPVGEALQENVKGPSVPVRRILLQLPFRGDGIRRFSRALERTLPSTFRESGSPFFLSRMPSPPSPRSNALRRTLGKLRVGLAMGSGSAYGYSSSGS